MQRIDLEPSSSHRGADSVLYLADRPSKRLLAWIDTDVVGNVPGITKLAHELTDEGWNVLHIRAAADAGADAIAGAIAAATSRGDASLGPPHVVVIAEAASVTAACAAVRNSHRCSEGVCYRRAGDRRCDTGQHHSRLVVAGRDYRPRHPHCRTQVIGRGAALGSRLSPALAVARPKHAFHGAPR